jgi:hypothetical protein
VQNLTSQHLARLYEEFAETEVTFNAQVILESGLLTPEVRLTVGPQHLPCVLYASSMRGARVILEVDPADGDLLLRNTSSASLHLGFRRKDDKAPVTFFIPCRVESLSDYSSRRPQVRFASLDFTQKPSDLLIETLGSLLEIKSNALRRRDQRIVLTPEILKRIGLQSRESCVAIEGTPRRCFLRDLSFGGAKVLLSTLGLRPSPGKVHLKLGRCEMPDDTILDGSIVRVEDVEGHADLVALSIQYSSDPPISYKQKINSVFSST